ncbi:hypothetical protein CAOG_004609 [Capsaspora owczarzaki ATCC 30864]|uniref:T-cell immunomodulatory protein TIP C2 domain-containing protein n=1 Tax=Capsaspora owczarzaki (strain ATCC 30864) TaxID=595528 RepID=A0A0D2UFI3_CAPO3|nr:hypothetical protein CAOG_004609 [Capsaspora owczarzaki ATCC 30864]
MRWLFAALVAFVALQLLLPLIQPMHPRAFAGGIIAAHAASNDNHIDETDAAMVAAGTTGGGLAGDALLVAQGDVDGDLSSDAWYLTPSTGGNLSIAMWNAKTGAFGAPTVSWANIDVWQAVNRALATRLLLPVKDQAPTTDGTADTDQQPTGNGTDPRRRRDDDGSTDPPLPYTSAAMTGVVPADVNFDGITDAAITFTFTGSDNVEYHSVVVMRGNGRSLEMPASAPAAYANNSLILSLVAPSIFDCSGDMVPDVFGVSATTLRYTCWANARTGQFEHATGSDFHGMGLNTTVPLVIQRNQEEDPSAWTLLPPTFAVADVSGDLMADILIAEAMFRTSDQAWRGRLLVAQNVGRGAYRVHQLLDLPVGTGHITFVDVDTDGRIDMLFPKCNPPESCASSSEIVVARNANLPKTGQLYGFDLSSDNVAGHTWTTAAFAATLRVGDLNLDGFVDVLVAVRNPTQNRDSAVLLVNSYMHTFSPSSLVAASSLSADDRILACAFMDLGSNANLDMVVSSVSLTSQNHRITPVVSGRPDDVYLLSVYISNGVCPDSSCDGKLIPDAKPYGISTYGPSVLCTFADESGDARSLHSVQLSQNGFQALDLPFVLIGLGRTTSYVDTLDVGVAYTIGGAAPTRQWPSLIPNSQVVIFPSPLDSPDSWIMELYLSPGETMLWTGVSLICTCVALAVVIWGLRYREKRQDEVEKRRTAHLFHFGDS